MSAGEGSSRRSHLSAHIRRRWLLVGVAVILALFLGRIALKRKQDMRLFGKWTADKIHWSEKECLLWLDFRRDGTVEQSWDHIGEVSTGEGRWFVDNDEIVLHRALYWDNRKTWDGVRANARLAWSEFLGTPRGVRRYRIRAVDDSMLTLEPGEGAAGSHETTSLRFHRERGL
jgi:hypothetical protein